MAHICSKNNVRLPAVGIVFLMMIGSVDSTAQTFPQQRFPLVSPYCGTLLSWFRVVDHNPAALAYFRDTMMKQNRIFFAVQPSRFGLSELNRLTAGILLPTALPNLPMSVMVHGNGGAKFTELQTAVSIGYAELPSFLIGGRLAIRYQRFGTLRTWLDGSWSTGVLVTIDTIWTLAATIQNFPHFLRAQSAIALYEATVSIQWRQPEASMEGGLLLRSFAAPSAYGILETAAVGLPLRIGYQLFPAVAEFSMAVPIDHRKVLVCAGVSYVLHCPVLTAGSRLWNVDRSRVCRMG